MASSRFLTETEARYATVEIGMSCVMVDPVLLDLQEAGLADPAYVKLMKNIEAGFPAKPELLDPDVRPYWNVRDQLSVDYCLILLGSRIVVPIYVDRLSG